ncbi:type II toxin-antitoxin system VapC family toxin [Flavobacterium lacus]|uniref:Putative nucleic acid-binding protein n=1 Tax=Flavobacterium lacus TaxID=1353778 RepID=A0A328WY09_9FLAO|nr:PIN domain-containing protein [Flavobacterium lacus]RAR51092.1 putative nucleic acid-binding protein [Flavobacterium lacus]
MSKKLFLDTNIVLDLLGEREPFYIPSAQLATLADQKKVKLIVSPISFATVNYFLAKSEGISNAKEKLRKFKILCEIATINESIVEKALHSDFEDFEDALQYFCALDSKCEIIITRNHKDFKHSLLPVMSAEEYLKSV